MTCQVCRCTDDHGCAHGCFWVAADLCSRCGVRSLVAAGRIDEAEFLDQLHDVPTIGDAEALASIDDQPRVWRPGDPL